MKISVIIPVYKVEKYLRECVDSVLCQTYRDLEIILVDDGSPDNCPQMCDDYAAADPRVKVIHKANGGLADARNAGIIASSGEYLLFLDSDDYWNDSNAVEKLVERVQNAHTDVLNFRYIKFDEETGNCTESKVISSSMPAGLSQKKDQLDWIFSNSLYIASACNKMISAEIVRECGLFFQTGETSEDIEWCARLLTEARSFDYLDTAFYCYRQREGSISHTIALRNVADLEKHIEYCAKLADEADMNIRKYVLQYAAYQTAVFVLTQSMAEENTDIIVKKAAAYRYVLKYCGSEKKVLTVRVLSGIIGYGTLCKWLKMIRKIRSK